MRTIDSRTYTNVALSVLIMLLLALVIRPYLGLPKAYAADNSASDRNSVYTRNVPLTPNADPNKGPERSRQREQGNRRRDPPDGRRADGSGPGAEEPDHERHQISG